MEIYKVHAEAWRHMSKIISEQSFDDVEPEVDDEEQQVKQTLLNIYNRWDEILPIIEDIK